MNTSRKALLALAPLLALVAGAACTTNTDNEEGTTTEDFGTVAAPGHVTLADVQKALKEKGATWTAGTTTMSKLSPAKRAGHFGVESRVKNDTTMRVVDDAPIPANAPLAKKHAASIDWRNNNGKNWISPILDQGQCGSCVAFSTTGTFETQLNIAAGTTDSPWQLSPEYLFMCGGASCDSGWEPGPAASFVKSKGIVDDACMPYTSGALGTDVSCSKACSNASSRAVKAQGFTTPTSGSTNLNAVKAALAKGPLVTTLTVYEDFMYYTSGVYKHVTGDVAGGHAVSIVGYNDTDQAWIVRNSWGTGWGMNGFIEVAYSDISGVSDETWQFTVPSGQHWVMFDGVRDYQVMSGSANVTFDSSETDGFSWTLSNSSGASVASGNATGNTASIDTTKVADGVYTLQAKAGTVATGEPKIVYVLNGQDTGSVKFKNLTAGQKLTGDVEVQVAITASPVPATSLQWVITNSAGVAIITTSSETVGNTVELGWGTARRPNGNYTVTVTAMAGDQKIGSTSQNVVLSNSGAPAN